MRGIFASMQVDSMTMEHADNTVIISMELRASLEEHFPKFRMCGEPRHVCI